MHSKEDGVPAVNQDFIRYEQVKKSQEYHLAETADEPFDDDFEVRIVSASRATLRLNDGV